MTENGNGGAPEWVTLREFKALAGRVERVDRKVEDQGGDIVDLRVEQAKVGVKVAWIASGAAAIATVLGGWLAQVFGSGT